MHSACLQLTFGSTQQLCLPGGDMVGGFGGWLGCGGGARAAGIGEKLATCSSCHIFFQQIFVYPSPPPPPMLPQQISSQRLKPHFVCFCRCFWEIVHRVSFPARQFAGSIPQTLSHVSWEGSRQGLANGLTWSTCSYAVLASIC